jgi:hypothetical protein
LFVPLYQQAWKVTLKLEMLDTRQENVIALVGATGEAYLARQERKEFGEGFTPPPIFIF